MKNFKKIHIDGTEIRLVGQNNTQEYIAISDIAKNFGEPRIVIANWLRARSTIKFLGTWERLNNTQFDLKNFESLLYESADNSFTITPEKWVEKTVAIGIKNKTGRNGGTFAHQDLALGFCYWISPEFQLYLIREFQRLKEDEAERLSTDWNIKRIMSKANYRIHTEAVREHLIPPKLQYTKMEVFYFASEADVINLALFGLTAKQWRLQNPDKKGNMRDHATPEQLLVLSNLQSLNAKLMKWGCDEEQRLQILNESAIEEMNILLSGTSLKRLTPKKKGLNIG
ncbi:MAG: KilA-N domain-containing protein [Saprospiraceae bacterium]|nr:KilA-N domain-containing protein [Saprospiraceae bacterium]